MAKSYPNTVIWVAQRFGKSGDDIERLMENIPSDITPAESVNIEEDPEINAHLHCNARSLYMTVDDESMLLSFDYAAELFDPLTDQKIYQIARLFWK